MGRAALPGQAPRACGLPSGALHPLGDEDVGVTGVARVSVRREDQVLPVRAEHGKAVELLRVRDPFQTGAVHIHREELEVAALGSCRFELKMIFSPEGWKKGPPS